MTFLLVFLTLCASERSKPTRGAWAEQHLAKGDEK